MTGIARRPYTWSDAINPGYKGLHNSQLGFILDNVNFRKPCETIANNAGVEGRSIVEAVMEGEPGYNAHTDEFVDMIQAGIVDPAKVIKQERIFMSKTSSYLRFKL